MGKIILYCIILVLPPLSSSFAATQCGPYRLTSGTDGYMHINGARPETQYFNFLKKNEDYRNVKMEWMMATDQPNTWVGLEYIKRDGKAILNAEWIRAGVTGIDMPRQLATYNCVRVK